ncbi:hypothetical protein AYK21_03770 [Thermoplasmatales archaeon SG8-52-2]|nr:MAG: hypothetical protein AYK21_03770 [Thermoplasmatales archaeon SG8-52-2]
MNSFHEKMNEYKEQMKKGVISEAYRGLMDYIMDLRTYLKKKYPNYIVSGSIYYGYMDMTYFSFFPESLKLRKLKTGIIFIHETCKFEVWLFGYNKKVQKKYWELIKKSNWNKYHIPLSINSIDSIIENTLVENPDFSDLNVLTKKIENGTLNFIKDVENFLVNH